MLEALLRPPCLVSFSGGRDSSAVLATATAVARREGLQLPIPTTFVVPGDPDADETEWQQTVLDHLGIQHRELIKVENGRFDLVGPEAQRTVSMLGGLTWPCNLHFHLPILELAGGGSVLTGFGGDELAISSVQTRPEELISRRRIDHPRDLLTVGLRVAPPPVRFPAEYVRSSRRIEHLPWLTARGRVAARAAMGWSASTYPLGWGRLLTRWMSRLRHFAVVTQNIGALGRQLDVAMAHPFIDDRVLCALGNYSPFTGVGNRPELLRLLTADRLPQSVLMRTSKAHFSAALWGEHFRAFERAWDGSGIDTTLVNVGALRAAWAQPQPHFSAGSLTQQAWLNGSTGSS